MVRTTVLALATLVILTGSAWATVADFDGLTLAADSYWNGGPVPGDHTFVSGPATFNNGFFYDAVYDMTSWGGWAYSNKFDTTTRDWTNQYSAVTGVAQGGANYGIGYLDTWNGVTPTVTLATPSVVDYAWFTNTTYGYYSILDGTGFSKKFGDEPDPDDWFLLTITGKDAAGTTTDSVEFYLADYRFADNARDYIVKDWTRVDLTSLKTVNSLEFTLASSDSSVDFGMNNPSYFAMDTLTVVPEPATLGLLAVGGLGVLVRGRRRIAKPLVVLMLIGAAAGTPSLLLAGPYAPAAGQAGSTAIHKDQPMIVEWASGITVVRGLADISNPGAGYASYGDPASALGKADGTSYGVLSLGDRGIATLTFDTPITNGPGFDFAVFENGFGDTYLELAFVEVSSNGTDFFRFPAVSLTPTDAQVGGFGALDPTEIHNLAGKYRQGYGTPFDLEDLAGVSLLLNVSRTTHVRLIDAVGCIQPAYATYDSLGNKVNDPWPTPFNSGGFDLDAVGVIHAVPEPGTAALAAGLALAAGRRRRA